MLQDGVELTLSSRVFPNCQTSAIFFTCQGDVSLLSVWHRQAFKLHLTKNKWRSALYCHCPKFQNGEKNLGFFLYMDICVAMVRYNFTISYCIYHSISFVTEIKVITQPNFKISFC